MNQSVTQDWLSPYALVQRADPRCANGNVCLVLSAAHVPAGKFLLSRQFSTRNEHCIFLNCPGNGWYLRGVPGLGGSLAEVATALRPIIDPMLQPGGRLILIGGSMGGYGAAVLGGLLRADVVFATGVEFRLGLNGGFSKRLNPGAVADFDIFAVMRNGTTRYFLGCGAECPTDLYCLSQAKAALGPQLLPFVLSNAGHSLPPLLEKQFGYGRIVDRILAGDTSPVLGDSTALLDHPALCAALQRVKDLHAGAEPDPRGVIRLLREQAQNSLPVIRGHAAYGLSSALALVGARRAALRAMEAAAQDLPGNFALLDGWAQLALTMGRPGQAERVARRALALPRPDGGPDATASFKLLFEALMMKGDRDGARQILWPDGPVGLEPLVASLRIRWQEEMAVPHWRWQLRRLSRRLRHWGSTHVNRSRLKFWAGR